MGDAVLSFLRERGREWTACSAIGDRLVDLDLSYPGQSLKRAISSLDGIEINNGYPSQPFFRLEGSNISAYTQADSNRVASVSSSSADSTSSPWEGAVRELLSRRDTNGNLCWVTGADIGNYLVRGGIPRPSGRLSDAVSALDGMKTATAQSGQPLFRLAEAQPEPPSFEDGVVAFLGGRQLEWTSGGEIGQHLRRIGASYSGRLSDAMQSIPWLLERHDDDTNQLTYLLADQPPSGSSVQQRWVEAAAIELWDCRGQWVQGGQLGTWIRQRLREEGIEPPSAGTRLPLKRIVACIPSVELDEQGSTISFRWPL